MATAIRSSNRTPAEWAEYVRKDETPETAAQALRSIMRAPNTSRVSARMGDWNHTGDRNAK